MTFLLLERNLSRARNIPFIIRLFSFPSAEDEAAAGGLSVAVITQKQNAVSHLTAVTWQFFASTFGVIEVRFEREKLI